MPIEEFERIKALPLHIEPLPTPRLDPLPIPAHTNTDWSAEDVTRLLGSGGKGGPRSVCVIFELSPLNCLRWIVNPLDEPLGGIRTIGPQPTCQDWHIYASVDPIRSTSWTHTCIPPRNILRIITRDARYISRRLGLFSQATTIHYNFRKKYAICYDLMCFKAYCTQLYLSVRRHSHLTSKSCYWFV